MRSHRGAIRGQRSSQFVVTKGHNSWDVTNILFATEYLVTLLPGWELYNIPVVTVFWERNLFKVM